MAGGGITAALTLGGGLEIEADYKPATGGKAGQIGVELPLLWWLAALPAAGLTVAVAKTNARLRISRVCWRGASEQAWQTEGWDAGR